MTNETNNDPITGVSADAQNTSPRSKNVLTVTVTRTEITDLIYSHSAWHCAIRPQLIAITPDRDTMVTTALHEAYTSLLARLKPWLYSSTFWAKNDTSSDACIKLKFRYRYSHIAALQLHDALAHLMAARVLMTAYAATDVYFGAAYRKHLSQILLIMAHLELGRRRRRHHSCN